MTTSSPVSYTPVPGDDGTEHSSDVATAGGMIATTQIPSRQDGSLELGDFATQASLTLANLKHVLEAAGSGLDCILHMTIYLTDIEDRAEFDRQYASLFDRPYPVRCAVGVTRLGVPGMKVELAAFAVARAHGK